MSRKAGLSIEMVIGIIIILIFLVVAIYLIWMHSNKLRDIIELFGPVT